MEKAFTFESVNFPQDLEVVVDISCREHSGVDYLFDYKIYRDGNVEVMPEELAEGEAERLQKCADETASQHALDAYQDYQEGKADRDYDAYVDRQMERHQVK
jgi:hypothetical protein